MEGASLYDEKLKGLIPRMFEYLFKKISEADPKVEFTIKCSYLEIYMEKICDLLDGKRPTMISWLTSSQPRNKTSKSKKTRREASTYRTPPKSTFHARKKCMKLCAEARQTAQWPLRGWTRYRLGPTRSFKSVSYKKTQKQTRERWASYTAVI